MFTFLRCCLFANSAAFPQVGLREASGDAGGEEDAVEDPSRSGTPVPDDDDLDDPRNRRKRVAAAAAAQAEEEKKRVEECAGGAAVALALMIRFKCGAATG